MNLRYASTIEHRSTCTWKNALLGSRSAAGINGRACGQAVPGGTVAPFSAETLALAGPPEGERASRRDRSLADLCMAVIKFRPILWMDDASVQG